MKRLLLLLLVIVSARAEVLLTDSFFDASLNPDRWKVIKPLAISTVTTPVAGGVITSSGGVLATNQPLSQTAYSLALTFQPQHSIEVFTIALRSSLDPTSFNQGYERVGLAVAFTDSSKLEISEYPASGNARLLASTFLRWTNAKAYSVTVVDTGFRVTVNVNGIEMLSAESSYRPGQNLAFYSRFFSNTATRIDGITVTTLPPNTPIENPGRLINLSMMTQGGGTLGFVVGGTQPKQILVRAVGPSLRNFGVVGAATRTSLNLFSSQTSIASNVNWSSAPNSADIARVPGPFPLIGIQGGSSADSAILRLVEPGAYTAQTTGDGMVLVEVYEVP